MLGDDIGQLLHPEKVANGSVITLDEPSNPLLCPTMLTQELGDAPTSFYHLEMVVSATDILKIEPLFGEPIFDRLSGDTHVECPHRLRQVASTSTWAELLDRDDISASFR